MIVGVSGEARSGKDTFASIYSRIVSNAQVVSLSDFVRQELAQIGVAPNRSLQRTVADYRRHTAGSAYWIDRAITLTLATTKTLILAGIYAPGETKYIQRMGGVMVWIEASESFRIRRIANRNDGHRDELLLRDPAAFSLQLETEKISKSTSGAMASLLEVKDIANYVVLNENKLSEFEIAINEIIDVVA